MHKRAQEADLIIVNHHLFFADLALKQDDFGQHPAEYSAVVFDEAHEMEDVASDYFGRQISNFSVRRAGTGRRSDTAFTASGHAVAAAQDTANPGTQPRLFRNCFRRATDEFSFLRTERRSVSGAEP